MDVFIFLIFIQRRFVHAIHLAPVASLATESDNKDVKTVQLFV